MGLQKRRHEEEDKFFVDCMIDNTVFKDADCIIFDCDGVLVDVSDSYYTTIRETVLYVLNHTMPHFVSSIKKDDIVNLHIIEKFKNAGRFNDEIDLSCAIILGAVVASNITPPNTDSTYSKVIDDIIRNSASGGIESVISYAQNQTDISDYIKYMEHPSDDRNGRLCRIFDQIFFGPSIYEKVRNRCVDIETLYDTMINRDKIIITDKILNILSKHFDSHVAMLTGRGIYSAQYTLGNLMKWFDVKNSAFLEDEPRVYAKPNPIRLAQCIQNMGCKKAIYVGDSVEDAIMACELSDIVFCGIIGTSKYPEKRRHTLLQAGASMILNSVLDIPKALNLVNVDCDAYDT